MSEVLILTVLSFVIFICYFIVPKSEKGKLFDSFPGPMKFPLIGNIWYLANAKDFLATFTELHNSYGNRVSLSGLKKTLILFHPEDVGKILTSKHMDKSSAYAFFRDWLGETVLITTANEHLRKRKMLQPALDFKRVDNFDLNCNEHSKTLVQILKTSELMITATAMGQLFKLCGLDIAFQYLVGKSPRFLKQQDSKFASAIDNEIKYINHRWVSPWLWPDILWKLSPTGIKEKISRTWLQNYIDKIVQDRKKEWNTNLSEMQTLLTEDGVSKQTFEQEIATLIYLSKLKLLDNLIQRQQQGDPRISDKYIREEMNAFIFGAHDTMASSLIFTVFLLAKYPEEQTKVLQEIDDVFGNNKDRSVTYQDLLNLKYLECCLKESLRLYPPVKMFSRKTKIDFQLDTGTIVPEGMEVMILPGVMHRLPEFWPEPDKFSPSRFLPENCAGRHPLSYIPFAAGSRNCIGQNLVLPMEKTILSHIFRNFMVELVEPTDKLMLVGDIVTYISDGLKFNLKKRQ